jgi:hypothetical protein
MCQLMAEATAAEIIGLSAKHAWAQASAKWPSPEEAKSIAQEAYVYAFSYCPKLSKYLSACARSQRKLVQGATE